MANYHIDRNGSTLMSCRKLALAVMAVTLLLLPGCGGGGGGGTTPPPGPSPSFTISLSPSTSQSSPLIITMGSAGAELNISVTGQNGFSGTVNLTISSLPTGVSATPSTLSIAAGQSQKIDLAATVDAPLGMFQVTVTGSAGSLSASSVLFGNLDVPQNSGVIGSGGGTVAITDPSSPINGVQLVVPPNALSGNVLIQMNPVPPSSLPQFPPGSAFAGMAVELLPAGLQFAQPATLSIPFADADFDGIVDGSNVFAQTLVPLSFDGTTQQFSLLEWFIDSQTHVVNADIWDFTRFFVLWGRFASNRVITYSFGNLPVNRHGTDIDLQDAITRALDTWSVEIARSGISFAPSAPGTNSDILFLSTDFSIGSSPCSWRYALTEPIAWLGTATVAFNNRPCVATPTGTVLGSWTGDITDTNATVQMETEALHELGHVLGLPHLCKDCIATACPPPDSASYKVDIMEPVQDQSCPLTRLGRDDIGAYRRHYGLLYAESGMGTASGPSVLYTVDPVIGGVDSPVGLITLSDGSTPAITDIALSSSGQLSGIDFSTLYTIDPLTGFSSRVGPLNSNGFNALGFDSRDMLFTASSSGQFAQLDTLRGTAKVIGTYSSGYTSSGDIVFVPTGVLYGTARRISDRTDQLVTINPASGNTSLVMNLGSNFVFGFAWVAPSAAGPWTPCFSGVSCVAGQFFGLTTDPTSSSSTGQLLLIDPILQLTSPIRQLKFNAFGAAFRPHPGPQ